MRRTGWFSHNHVRACWWSCAGEWRENPYLKKHMWATERPPKWYGTNMENTWHRYVALSQKVAFVLPGVGQPSLHMVASVSVGSMLIPFPSFLRRTFLVHLMWNINVNIPLPLQFWLWWKLGSLGNDITVVMITTQNNDTQRIFSQNGAKWSCWTPPSCLIGSFDISGGTWRQCQCP